MAASISVIACGRASLASLYFIFQSFLITQTAAQVAALNTLDAGVPYQVRSAFNFKNVDSA